MIIQVVTLTFQFLKSRKENNFVQYSFRLSVLALYLCIQHGIDLVYNEAQNVTKGMIFSIVIIRAGKYLTFQFH